MLLFLSGCHHSPRIEYTCWHPISVHISCYTMTAWLMRLWTFSRRPSRYFTHFNMFYYNNDHQHASPIIIFALFTHSIKSLALWFPRRKCIQKLHAFSGNKITSCEGGRWLLSICRLNKYLRKQPNANPSGGSCFIQNSSITKNISLLGSISGITTVKWPTAGSSPLHVRGWDSLQRGRGEGGSTRCTRFASRNHAFIAIV